MFPVLWCTKTNFNIRQLRPTQGSVAVIVRVKLYDDDDCVCFFTLGTYTLLSYTWHSNKKNKNNITLLPSGRVSDVERPLMVNNCQTYTGYMQQNEVVQLETW